MQRSVRIALRVLLSLLFGLFSLPMLIVGGYLFVCWFRIHTSDVYYVDYPYAITATSLIALGALSLWTTLHGVWRRSFYGSLFVIPIFLGLVSMVAGPEHIPRAYSGVADSNYLADASSFLRGWYEKNHRFPANEAEIRDAWWRSFAGWARPVETSHRGRYMQRGNHLPYEIVVVTNAQGPRMTDVSQRPGVIYYGVSTDHQEFWLVMTELRSDVAPSADLRLFPNDAWGVIHAVGRDYPAREQ
jgi:hypothetical protein